jgi:membrane fusion protein
MTQTTLFRSQVAQCRKDNWLGEAQIVQPLPIRIVALTCIGLILATLAFAIFGTYTRRVHAEGVMEPNVGLITVVSPRAGRVGSAGVHEGDCVEKGQFLYAIDVDAVSANGPTQVRIIAQLEQQKASVERQKAARAALAVIEKQALQEQLDNSISQRDQLAEQIALQDKLVTPVKDRTDVLAGFVERGISRASEFQSQNYLYLQADAQLAQFRQISLQLAGKIADLKSQIAEFDDKLARELAEMDRAMAQLEQQIAESEAQQAIEVRAPGGGHFDVDPNSGGPAGRSRRGLADIAAERRAPPGQSLCR